MKRNDVSLPPLCHPARPQYCKGLCLACYSNKRHHNNKANSKYLEAKRLSSRKTSRKLRAETPKEEQWRYRPENQMSTKASYFKANWGLSIEEYEAMFIAQGGKCAICNLPPRNPFKRIPLSIDHDHATGKIRGLLCGPCNSYLGKIENNPELLTRIKNHQERDMALGLQQKKFKPEKVYNNG